jgi:hypothetical protein
MMTGDGRQLEKYLAEPTLKELDEMAVRLSELGKVKRTGAELLIYLSRLNTPVAVTVKEGTSGGDSAKLVTEGVVRGKKYRGEVKMILEGGQWKVISEKWNTAN